LSSIEVNASRYFSIMKLTYYGHFCFSVLIGKTRILFDPFITPNELAKNVDISYIEPDYIFVSHGHYDHITDVVLLAKKKDATVVGSWELNTWFAKNGLKKTQPLNPGGQFEFEFGIVKCVVAHHSSSFPDGSYAGVACGFLFQTADGNFYYSGDTGLTLDMQLIPKWAKLDFAVFPVGGVLTMGIDDAITAAQFVKVNKVVGVHYDTFGLIRIDHERAIESFRKEKLTLHLLEIGTVTDI
jgi:L-ascorbate metabolism protein UlaG (beta-lactamase superfamily)